MSSIVYWHIHLWYIIENEVKNRIIFVASKQELLQLADRLFQD